MKRANAVPMTSGGGAKRELRYLRNAPEYLVNLHKNRKVGIVKLGVKGDLLGELLTLKSMGDVWDRLGRRITDDDDWLRIWQEIRNAISDSRNPPNPDDEKQYCDKVAKSALELAEMLQRKSGKAIFDLPAYRFCPDEDMKANGIENWNSFDSIAQARKSIIWWPSMADLLLGMKAMAEQTNKIAKHDSRVMHRIARDSNASPTMHARETLFLRLLHPHLSVILRAKSDGINVVLSQISAVVFSHPNDPRTPKEVSDNIHGA